MILPDAHSNLCKDACTLCACLCLHLFIFLFFFLPNIDYSAMVLNDMLVIFCSKLFDFPMSI